MREEEGVLKSEKKGKQGEGEEGDLILSPRPDYW